jgi:hypothetical protein
LCLCVSPSLFFLSGGPPPAAGAPPAAHAAERCDGVWVVVDATELGGSVTTRCAEGDPSSGLAALEAAGHSYTFVPRVPGMVCTIDQRPEPCNGAPSEAYWSYWHADEGGSWTYASRGAGERDPQPGTVEGWAFGAGDRPGTSPPQSAPSSSGEDTSSSGTSDSSGSSGSSGSSDSSGSSGSSGTSGSSGASGASDSSSGSSSGSSDSSPGDAGSAGSSSGTAASKSSSTGDAPASEEAAGGEAEDDADSGADDGDAGQSQPIDEDDEDDVQRRGAGADADDVLAGREMGDDGDESPDRDDLDREEADEVAVGAPSSGGSWLGVAAGTALAGSLAGAAVWQARRRNAATSGSWAPGS